MYDPNSIINSKMTLTLIKAIPNYLLIICNFVLLITTACYVIITKRILNANKKAVQIMQEELDTSLRPFIQIVTYLIPGNYMICLKISNVGKTAAEKLRLEIDKDFYQYGSKEEIHNLKLAYVFNNEIEMFAPRSELLFYLGFGNQIFDEKTDSRKTPNKFKITAKYIFFGREVLEETIIDLQIYLKSQLPPQEAIVTQLKEIKSAIDELKKPKDEQKE